MLTVTLLKEKIEKSIEGNKPVIVIVSNHYMEVRNTIYVDNYEIEEDGLYLNNGNFELHINLSEIDGIIHDDLFGDEIMITDKSTDTEVKLCFCE